jgi:hypothetical protein
MMLTKREKQLSTPFLYMMIPIAANKPQPKMFRIRPLAPFPISDIDEVCRSDFVNIRLYRMFTRFRKRYGAMTSDILVKKTTF